MSYDIVISGCHARLPAGIESHEFATHGYVRDGCVMVVHNLLPHIERLEKKNQSKERSVKKTLQPLQRQILIAYKPMF